MYLIDWFLDQKLSDWVQGLGSLAAAGAAVGIALRQERNEHRRAEEARALRRHVLAAAISPILRDMRTSARFRSGMLQSIGRPEAGDEKPHVEELVLLLPDIFMATIDRIDVFGAYTAGQVYTLIHHVNDYNRHVRAQLEWDVPPRTWSINLRPKLDGVIKTLDILMPRVDHEVDKLEEGNASP
jgi:hypothetical protein